MAVNKTYAINATRAISETIDGETIIINMEDGTYYSMNETGSLIWNDIQSGYSIDQVVEHLSHSFDAPIPTIEASVIALTESLMRDNLIIESKASTLSSIKSTTTKKKLFVPPIIEKYEDMQDMLLADPIHDVDQAGWPKRKESK